ncbi:hypothetical protein ASPCAL07774 [Aspergillus calidoustus]|uniref:Uncharacterized protein n=1 Tax=Aspergillus calidoustus TaxID=454130 RepID=A0A0U5GNJ3_ASPCI|nr:hypothetical protein ASPCAL07774 [Aspergillus calidoustus]
MGKAKKFLEDFISKIPDEKLSGSAYRQILYKDTDFWLEGAGLTPDEPKKFIIEIRMSRNTKLSSLGKFRPTTALTNALVPQNGSWSSKMIRDELLSNIVLLD